jgi:hypothetical protein
MPWLCSSLSRAFAWLGLRFAKPPLRVASNKAGPRADGARVVQAGQGLRRLTAL